MPATGDPETAVLSELRLGSRGRASLSPDGIDAKLKRRGAAAGITDLHPHAFRHT
jgi:hypothetical protein